MNKGMSQNKLGDLYVLNNSEFKINSAGTATTCVAPACVGIVPAETRGANLTEGVDDFTVCFKHY